MQTALTYRTNRDLFSNYYLDEHLLKTEAWEEVTVDWEPPNHGNG